MYALLFGTLEYLSSPFSNYGDNSLISYLKKKLIGQVVTLYQNYSTKICRSSVTVVSAGFFVTFIIPDENSTFYRKNLVVSEIVTKPM